MRKASQPGEASVDEISTLLRRSHPGELQGVGSDGQRAELAELLDTIHAELRDLAELITETQLTLPGGMQPLWGGDERRVMP